MYCVLWFATHLTKPLIVSSWSEGDSGFPRQVAAFMVTKNDLSVLLALHDETVQWLPKGLWASVLSCVQLIVLSDSKWKHGRPVYQVYNWPHVTRDCWGIWRVPQRHPLPHSPAAGASASFNSLLWVLVKWKYLIEASWELNDTTDVKYLGESFNTGGFPSSIRKCEHSILSW